MLRIEHECELDTEPDDMFLPPVRNLSQRVSDAFRRSLMATDKNPGARKYLRSRASIVLEKRRHLRNFKLMFHPFSTFRHCWDFAMIFTIMCLLLTVPYKAVFEVQTRPLYWTVVKNVLLSICCLDIIVNFMTGYFDKVQHTVVMEPLKVTKKYLRHGMFLPDLLGSLPTDIAFVKTWQQYTVLRELLSFMCIFRAFSLNSYLKKIAQVYNIRSILYDVCIVIFWLTIGLHWQSCLHWFVPIVTTSIYLPQHPSNDSWIYESNLLELSKSKQYLSCLLRSLSVFLRSSLLHSKPKNEADLALVIILQILGFLTVWTLIARVMQLYKGTSSSKIKYRSTIAQLKQYMRYRQLPYSTQRHIMTYYAYRYQHQYIHEVEIINTISSQMRQEIRMYTCRKLVENVTFFNNLPLSLLVRIVGLLKPEIFLTNDVIMQANQPGDCMYFIATGTVAIYTSSGKEVCHLEDGAHFGEIALVMPDERRVASVIAVETCKLYRLDGADFVRTIHPYPILWERIKKIAIERHEKTMILNA